MGAAVLMYTPDFDGHMCNRNDPDTDTLQGYVKNPSECGNRNASCRTITVQASSLSM